MLRWYGIFIALGVGVGLWLTLREANRKSIDREHVLNALFWVIPAGLVGARLLHVIDDWPNHAANPWTIIGTDGLAIFGALIGGLLALILYVRVHQLPLGRFVDAVAPAVPLAQAIGRIGCFINGTPTTFFIDPAGILRDVVVGGPLERDYLDNEIAALRNPSAP